jgi:hypothetical protein
LHLALAAFVIADRCQKKAMALLDAAGRQLELGDWKGHLGICDHGGDLFRDGCHARAKGGSWRRPAIDLLGLRS